MASQINADLSVRDRAREGAFISPPPSRFEGVGGIGNNNNNRSDSSSKSPRSSSTVDSIDFRFLNFTHPRDAKNAQTRRNVRSHVTSKQHEKQRKAAAAEQARRNQLAFPPAALSSNPLFRAASEQIRCVESSGPSETDTSSPEATSPVSPALSYLPVRISPMELYPANWHPYLRPILDHYLTTMSIDLPETDAVSRELLRTTYMAIVMADNASFHALMLVAGAHYNQVRPQQPHKINLLQLRGMAIQEINHALTDHSIGGRATSDQLIAAVGKMATYELLFGQRQIFHTHMTGLQRIVSLRGGLQALGRTGLLERILLWIDANAAAISGGALYFPAGAYASSFGHPRVNKHLFILGLQAAS